MFFKKSSFVFAALLFGPGVRALDRLAADAVSAAYRTGIPDETALAIPANIQNTLISDPQGGLPLLVTYLTQGVSDEFLKVKRIHDWITDNIAYDSDLLLGLSDQGSRKVNELVKFKRTTCGGYSHLFHQMAALAGLKVETVTGNSKTCWIKSSNRDCHHVWNAVEIGGKWYYIDTTADGRFTFKHGAFTPKKRYHDAYLFIRPEAKMLINLPLEERQQFISTPLSKAAYLAMPRVSVLYYRYAIEYSPATKSLFRDARRDFEGGALEKVFDIADSPQEVFELRFKAPANISFFPQIVKDASESFDDAADSAKRPEDINARAFCFRENAADVVCQYSAAQAGRYKAYLSAKEAGDLYKFGLVHAFTLVAAKPGPLLPQQAGKLFTGALFDYQNFTIHATDFNLSGFPSIDVSRPTDKFITSFVFDEKGKQVPSAVEYSFLSPGRIKFFYKFPAAGAYWVRLQTRIPDEPGADRQNVAVVRLEVPTATATKFPPQNEVIFTKAFAQNALSFVETNLGTEAETVRVTISGAQGKSTECVLYRATGKAVAGGCTTTRDGDKTYYQFTPVAGRFGGRIYIKEGNKKSILGYFSSEK